MKPSHAANDNHVDRQIARTRQVWQPRLGRDLGDEDARQFAQNLTGFFGILAEWSRAEKLAAANDAATPNNGEAPMKAEAIAKALDGRKAGGGWMARCPGHDDRDGDGE